MKYTFVSKDYWMSLRSAPGVENQKLEVAPPNAPMYGDEVEIFAVAEGLSLPGDKWLHVEFYNDRVVDYWVAVIHRGQVYGQLHSQEPGKAFSLLVDGYKPFTGFLEAE